MMTTKTKRLKMILTRDRKKKNNGKKKRRLGRIKTNRKWTKTKDKHRERKLGSKKLEAILHNPRQPLSKRTPRLWRSRREREWMWQLHFSAHIAEKNSEVYSLIRKIYAELFPQVYNLFLMLPKVVFLFLLLLHSGSFKLHFKIFRLSSQNSPLFFRFVLKELIQTERDYVKSLGEVVEVSPVIFTLKRFGTNLQSIHSAFWHFLALSFFPGILSRAR